MRFAQVFSSFALLVLAAGVHAQSHVNPRNQILWPSGCFGGQAYVPATNTCADITTGGGLPLGWTTAGSGAAQVVQAPGAINALTINGAINEQLKLGVNIGLRVNAAVTTCAGNPCQIVIPATEGPGTGWTTPLPNNVILIDQRVQNGQGFAIPTPQPFLVSGEQRSLYLGANSSFESNVNSGYFVQDLEVVATAGGTLNDGRFANAGGQLIFGSRLSGNRPLWGQDINIQAANLFNTTYATEYDIINNSATHDFADTIRGLVLIAGGAKNPGMAISVTGSGASWEDVGVFQNYARSGFQFIPNSGRNYDIGFYPPANDNSIEMAGFNAARTAVVWERDDNGNEISDGAMNAANFQVGGHAGGVIVLPAQFTGYSSDGLPGAGSTTATAAGRPGDGCAKWLTQQLASTGLPCQNISLTTTGTSGPATFVGGVLNVPQYAGGGGGGLSYTTPTVNFIPKVTNATAPGTVGNSSLSDDGTNVSTTEPLTAPSFSTGAGAGVTVSSGSSLPGTCTKGDMFFLTSAAVAFQIRQQCTFTNVWTPLDSSIAFMKAGTPTFSAGSGAGTTPTVTEDAGFSDADGVINLTTGTTPTAGGGAMTIIFGGTYATKPACDWWPVNAAAAALSGTSTPYPSEVDDTVALNVFKANSVALTAATAYKWRYACH